MGPDATRRWGNIYLELGLIYLSTVLSPISAPHHIFFLVLIDVNMFTFLNGSCMQLYFCDLC